MSVRVAHLTTVDMSVRHLLLNQILALRDAGFDVTAISAPGPDLAAVQTAGVRHLPVSFTRRLSPLADLRAALQLWRIFRRERFAIVHTHQAKAALIGQVVARLSRVPIVVNTLHGFYFHEATPHWKRRLWVALERLQALFSERILSQNPEDIDTAIAELICSRDRIEWLGNGIDLTRFDPDALGPDTRRDVRAELGMPEGAQVVGFVGRLVREKGILDLFQAFRSVLDRFPDARLLVVGPEDRIKSDVVSVSSVGEYGIADRTHFVGYRSDTPRLYAAMDVCVLPSHREGFPRSPMEASAMGIPCVATAIRGCRQVVRPGVNGYLVPVADPDALADAIARVLGHPDEARLLGAGGRVLARREFDERLVFARVADAYRRLLTAKGLPSDVVAAATAGGA